MRQSFRGVVVSALMPKTVKVRAAIQRVHPKVLKTINLHRNFMAHDESNSLIPGDVVRIEACRPLSATKRFAVAEVLQRTKIRGDKVGSVAGEIDNVKATPKDLGIKGTQQD